MPDWGVKADATNNTHTAKSATSREPVDKQRSRSSRVCQVSFKHGHLEGQLAAFGLFRTTTASFTDVPSLLITDMVALGGSLAKLLLPTSLA